jgi:adenylate kinase
MPPRVENKCDQGHGELLTRDDDKIEAIKNRLAVYKKQTEPLIEYYREEGLLVDINAGATPSKVVDLALNALKSR